jgi:nitrous oxidase accessory protein
MKLLATILLLLFVQFGYARTIIVGKHELISSLRKGIEVANDGDTVIVKAGTYKEGSLVISKAIRLIGVGGPVLDGENKNEILTLSGANILVKGIRFEHAGYSAMNDYAAIKIIDARNIIIENNTITNAYFAIHIANTSFSVIRNNTIKGNPKTEQTTGNGVHLWKCNNMVIRDNHIQGHRDGIYFEFVTQSIISGNFSTKNIRYGLHFMFSNSDTYIGNTFKDNGAGVAVMFSRDVLMVKNNFDKNWGPNAYGILLKEISGSRIIQNTFHQNTVGIMMEGTNRIDVQMNAFTNNGWAMKVQASCDDNTFHHNNYQGNTFDVATNGTMMLNRFYNNYWDKYEGYDLDKNGFGDVSYHPVSMYAMVIEQNPNSLILLRSFMVTLLDKAEKAIPSLTPENLVDEKPFMKPLEL